MNKKKNISQKNKEIWEEYIKNPSDIFDKEYNTKEKSKKFIRYKFDLHGFTLSEANKKVEQIICNCAEENYDEILLITGKGLHSNNAKDPYVSKNFSNLKFSIPDYINSSEDLIKKVKTINIADKKDGGEGAILIKLKKL
ncbi:MAG: Smr/MutS family protein [Pelagibacteraceae bacterium]